MDNINIECISTILYRYSIIEKSTKYWHDGQGLMEKYKADFYAFDMHYKKKNFVCCCIQYIKTRRLGSGFSRGVDLPISCILDQSDQLGLLPIDSFPALWKLSLLLNALFRPAFVNRVNPGHKSAWNLHRLI